MRPPAGEGARQLIRGLATETDDCVEWTMCRKEPWGYGQLRLNKGGRLWYAHRLACEFAHGPGPKGMHAAHSCGNPPCFNPRHLRWATPKENAEDSRIHGTMVLGSKKTNAKLSEADVAFIRSVATGKWGEHARLSELFGVSPRLIAGIIKGTRWQHA